MKRCGLCEEQELFRKKVKTIQFILIEVVLPRFRFRKSRLLAGKCLHSHVLGSMIGAVQNKLRPSLASHRVMELVLLQRIELFHLVGCGIIVRRADFKAFSDLRVDLLFF